MSQFVPTPSGANLWKEVWRENEHGDFCYGYCDFSCRTWIRASSGKFLCPLSEETVAHCVTESNGLGSVKWTFSHQAGKCQSFTLHSGCELPSSNVFDSQRSCEESCVYATCFLSPLASQCQINTQYWFYSTINGTCLPYPAGSCPSSTNSFADEIDCYASCAKALCVVGFSSSPCETAVSQGMYQRWFLNITSGRCQLFSYQNCGQFGPLPNLNNFLTEQECVDLCHCDEEKLPGIKCDPRLRDLRLLEHQGTTEASTTGEEELIREEFLASETPPEANDITVGPQKHTNKPELRRRTLHIAPREEFHHLTEKAENVQPPELRAAVGAAVSVQEQKILVTSFWLFLACWFVCSALAHI